MTRTAPRQTSWDDLESAHRRATSDHARHEGTPPHEPTVAVLTCADARVSPARSFDLPAGALFVVRVAGATATTEAVASLTYAVEALGASTVVVLGHTECGAVSAALQGVDDPALEPLVAPIRPALTSDCADTACAVPAHVVATVAALTADPGPLGDAVRSDRVTVHGAVIDITDGSLTRLPTTPPRQEPS